MALAKTRSPTVETRAWGPKVRSSPDHRSDPADLMRSDQRLGHSCPGPAVRTRGPRGQILGERSVHRTVRIEVVVEYESGAGSAGRLDDGIHERGMELGPLGVGEGWRSGRPPTLPGTPDEPRRGWRRRPPRCRPPRVRPPGHCGSPRAHRLLWSRGVVPPRDREARFRRRPLPALLVPSLSPPRASGAGSDCPRIICRNGGTSGPCV